MTAFEAKGIQKQYGATSAPMAKKNFEYSCNLCSKLGKRIACTDCAIATAHHDMLNFVFNK